MVGLHPTTESNLRTALGVEICKLCIIARIWKPLSGKFSDLCREMGKGSVDAQFCKASLR